MIGGLIDATSLAKVDVSKQLSSSLDGPFNRMLLIRSGLGLNGLSPVNALPHNPATILDSEEIPRVPVSAVLSPLMTWNNSSIVADSSFSPARFLFFIYFFVFSV